MSLTTRREWLKKIGLGGAVAALGTAGTAMGAVCQLTPAQALGPFYPQNNPLTDQNNDLTLRPGATAKPKGTVVYVRGTVLDKECRPVVGALVEIWQAAASGRYQHSGDTSGLELDPNFSYWGEILTDAKGEYLFKTIIPGHYPADTDWVRPPHIHVKVTKLGFRELVTQMYFHPKSFKDPQTANLVARLNDEDLILKRVPAKDLVTVEFLEVPVGTKLSYERKVIVAGKTQTIPGAFTTFAEERLGTFDITLRSVR